MPDGEDALEFYHNIIGQAQNILIGPIEADFMAWGGGNLVRCIAELASALRASRASEAKLEKILKARNDAEIAYHAQTGL